jgi:hypothetical protein
MSPTTPFKNNILKKILQNVVYENMYVEKLHKNENLIIIPLKNEYFSQHVNSQKNKPLQYLILVENEDGKIRRSDIILFFPENAALKKLPFNSFSDFFDKEELPVDGIFTLVSFGDVKQFEMVFKNGKKDKFNLWRGEKKNYASNNTATSTSSQNCIDWYLVTTYYENGLPINSTWEYVGTTCNSSSCPPNMQCDVTGDEGGGGSSEIPTAVSRNVDFAVKRELTSYEDWEIKGHFVLQGQSFNNTSNNYFTSVTYNSSACTYYSFTASSNNPSHSRYSIYSEVSHTSGLINSTSAFGRIDSKMFYPNWVTPSGPSPKTDNYGLAKNWHASIELY